MNLLNSSDLAEIFMHSTRHSTYASDVTLKLYPDRVHAGNNEIY